MNSRTQPSPPWTCIALATLALFATTACGDDAPPKPSPKPSCIENCGEDTSSPDVSEDVSEDPSAPDVSPDIPEDLPPPELPRVIVSVETVVSTPTASAGSNVTVTCLFKDQEGNDVALDEAPQTFILTSPATSFDDNPEPNTITPTRVGQATVACLAPSLTLQDTSPETLDITPGPPYSTDLTLSTTSLVAGESIEASCEVFDPFGNLIPDEPWSLELDPPVEPNDTDPANVRTITSAGPYNALCQHPTATRLGARPFEVTPDLPAQLLVTPVPDLEVYTVGQIVEFASTVTDRFGNIVPDATIATASIPNAAPFGSARLRFQEEGTHTVTVAVTSPTQDDVPLSTTLTLEVGGLGPAITCTSPTQNSMHQGTPGETLTLTGTVQDPNGVNSVLVRGQSATLNEDGTFSVPIETRFGINFVDVLAIDENGATNTTTCAFLLSDTWAAEDAFLDDAISLRLLQGAFDDSDRNDPTDSLNDLLFTALNSPAVRNTLHDELSANNPLKPDSCDQDVCVPFLGCSCVLRSRVDYLDSQLNGPHTTTLSLLDGGLRADIRLRNIRVRVRVRGRATAIPYDTTGWVTLSELSATINFNVRLQDGQPFVGVRSIENTRVGSVSTSFNGLDGAVVNIVVGLFQGTVRNLIRDTLRSFISESFDDVLSGVLSGLDISSLGASFEVPRLDQSGTIPLSFGIRFSHINANTTRLLFGLAPRLGSTPAHSIPSRGIATPSGSLRSDFIGTQTAAVSIHTTFLNQALHTLWRAGLFHADLNSETLSGLPEGSTVTLETHLPPTLLAQNDRSFLIALAGLDLRLTWPGLFDEPIRLLLGAEATTSAQLIDGDTLAFDPVEITHLSFSTPDINLDPTTKNILQNFLQSFIQNIANSTLNDALPTLPIPSFDIPDTLSDFGIPAITLGLRSPSISIDANHIRLRGNFGTP